MSDAIDRAIDALVRAVDNSPEYAGNLPYDDARTIAHALTDAGLLATEAHDRAVAARALRDAADWWSDAALDCSDTYRPGITSVAADLRERASRIERGDK